MRKIIALLLAICLLLTFAACSSKNNNETKPTERPSANDTTPGDNPTTEGNQYSDDRYKDDSQYDGDVTIPNTVLYDDKDIKIVATKIDVSWDEPCVVLSIENNSNTDIRISVDNLIVNGVSTYGDLNASVSAGKKAVAELELFGLYLDYAQIGGVDEIGTIACEKVEILDDKWKTIDTFGFEIRTSIADTLKYTPNTDGNVIYEDENIKVVHQPDFKTVIGDKGFMFVIENKSDRTLDINFEDISINGYMVQIYAFAYISSGTVSFVPMTISDKDLANLQIKATDITEVAFKIAYTDMDYDRWETTEEISIKLR